MTGCHGSKKPLQETVAVFLLPAAVFLRLGLDKYVEIQYSYRNSLTV